MGMLHAEESVRGRFSRRSRGLELSKTIITIDDGMLFLNSPKTWFYRHIVS